MDLKTATSLLPKEQLTKYFKEQCKHFKREETSNLKDYFDIVKKDATAWLRSLPNSVRSKSTFHKYKAPLYALLEHKEVVALYGEEYCSTVSKNLKQAFKDSIQDVINERTKENIVLVEDTETICTEENHDSDDEQSQLDLDSLEVAEPTKTNLQESTGVEDYKQKYFALKSRYDDLQKELTRVKCINERSDNELSRVWGILDKIVSK